MSATNLVTVLLTSVVFLLMAAFAILPALDLFTVSATNLVTVLLTSVVFLIMAAFATLPALDLFTVSAPSRHVVRFATLGALTRCVTSSSTTRH